MAREVKQTLKFDNEGTFKAYNAACRWCNENDYSYGSSSIDGPMAMFKGDCFVSKWRNLSKKEQNSCDGIITGDNREGPVLIIIYN